TAPGSGNSGNILLNSTNLTYFDNSRLLTALEPGSSGEGGNIEIDAQKLQLENYSLIDTGTYSKGDAGNVNVSAQEIYLNNGSSILSLTSGRGNAGDINLEITDKVSLTNQSKIATAAISSTGNSGNIDITSNSFFLSSGSQLLALTQGGGSSGDINLNVNEIVDIRGIGADGSLSGIFTSSESLNSGTGGDITIETSDLNIINGGVLSAQTFSQSDGGNITVNANNVSLQNGGQMLTNTFETGSAGEIAINATGNVNIAGIDSEFESRPTPIKVAEQEFSTDLYSCKFGNCSQTLSEQEPNNSLETAQKITEEQFSLNSLKNTNENVEFSTRIPYVSIGATVDNSVDYYAVEVKQAGTRAVFDLDYEGVDLDAKLTLFNNQGDELAANNNASDNLGAGGSQSFIGGLDPYLRYTFTKPGTYFIKVNQADGSGIPSFFSSLDYGLQISLETPPLTASTVNSGAASGIFARTEGIGTAGNIEINTPQFNITDAAQLTVSSKSNSSAGDLLVDAKIVNINNQAKISAETESGISGNVQFNNLESLQLNQNSQITASTVQL
ncbi:MAG: PPC domain-containing protein, partial [Cyanobacteria bacterium J06641_2]